jgi:hypothetical protein
MASTFVHDDPAFSSDNANRYLMTSTETGGDAASALKSRRNRQVVINLATQSAGSDDSETCY